MSKRQYAACKFRSSDTRTFTYHNDGEPVAPGDAVKLPNRHGDGWTRGEVVSVTDQLPPFSTKGILGKIEPEPTAANANDFQPDHRSGGEFVHADELDQRHRRI